VFFGEYALCKRFLDIILEYGHNGLIHNRTMVQGLGDKMNRRAMKPYARLKCAPVGRQAGEAGQ
jgi:hypothetical protein